MKIINKNKTEKRKCIRTLVTLVSRGCASKMFKRCYYYFFTMYFYKNLYPSAMRIIIIILRFHNNIITSSRVKEIRIKLYVMSITLTIISVDCMHR